MQTVFYVATILVIAAVVIVLVRGLWNLMKGGNAEQVQQAHADAHHAAALRRDPDRRHDHTGARRPLKRRRPKEEQMVILNKIYTRTGDDGTTGLSSGERRPKSDLRVAAYGTVDEANSVIGLARLHTADMPELDAMLARVQNDCFDLGADLATPAAGSHADREPLRVTDAQVARLEGDIDTLNRQLQPLRSFVLPGRQPGRRPSSPRQNGHEACGTPDRRARSAPGRSRQRGGAALRQPPFRPALRRRPRRERGGQDRRALDSRREPIRRPCRR